MENDKIIKKFTAIRIETKTVDYKVQLKLSYGDIEGPFYDQTKPTEEFDSEQEAMEYAYKMDKYATWLIVPVIRFSYIDDNKML